MSEEKNVNVPQQEAQQDVNELRQIRVDKLEALQAEGRDPFVITKYDQTHHSTVIKSKSTIFNLIRSQACEALACPRPQPSFIYLTLI